LNIAIIACCSQLASAQVVPTQGIRLMIDYDQAQSSTQLPGEKQKIRPNSVDDHSWHSS
jgi:hypothetical protein